METVINIKVTVELPEWLKALTEKLMSNGIQASVKQEATEQPAAPEAPAKPAAPAAKPASKPAAPAQKPEAPAKPAAPAAKPKMSLGKPAAPAAKPAASAAKPADDEPETELTINDVRELLKQKFEGNAATIKAKLLELGAENMTKLDPSHYQEMYDFLSDLD